MPTRQEDRERQYNQQQLETLCGVARQQGRWGGVLFFGWTKEGLPAVVTEQRLLSPVAQSNLELTMAAKRSGSVSNIDIAGKIQAVQYNRVVELKDYLDESSYKTQDIFAFDVLNGSGSRQTVNVTELDFLNGLANSCLTWQTYNSKTLLAEEGVTPALRMYTLLLPDATQKVSYGLLFKSRLENESNESAFKIFLRRTFKDLIDLDNTKPLSEQKGYQKALMMHIKGKGVRGGLAYKLLNFVDNAFIDVPDDYMEQIKQDSDERNLFEQGLILAREVGLLDENLLRRYEAETGGKLNEMDVEGLLRLGNVMLQVVSRKF